jgi:cyclic pyranopterin phosphate synthase
MQAKRSLRQFREKLGTGPDIGHFLRQGTNAADEPLRESSVSELRAQIQQFIGQDGPRLHALDDNFKRRHNYLRISLTERCNLRCQYCMPENGVQLQDKSDLLSTEEMLKLARMFVECGVDKIRLTGGEPLVHKEIVHIASELSGMGIKTLAITTNGLTLPRKVGPLQEAGVNLLNVSLDTLKPDRFEAITRRKGWHKVVEGIEKAASLGFSPVKVNVVVQRGVNDDELGDFVMFTKDLDVDVRFIEWMPFDKNQWNDDVFVSYAEMKEKIAEQLLARGEGTIADTITGLGGSPDINGMTEGGGLQRALHLNRPNDTAKAYQVPGHKVHALCTMHSTCTPSHTLSQRAEWASSPQCRSTFAEIAIGCG